MKKIVLCILLIISLSLCSCDLFVSQEKYDEIYEEGYDEGYFEGCIDGEYDKLKEDFKLLWFPTYLHNGKKLSNNGKYESELATIRLRAEEVGQRVCILNIDLKISGVNDMSGYADSDAIGEMFGATCWHFDNDSYFVEDELYIKNYTFTGDGYLSDKISLHYSSDSDTVPIILFVHGQVIAIEFDPFN